MSASSVTGTGSGESKGLYKSWNNNGCGCGGKKDEPAKPLPLIGCNTKYSVNRGGASINGGSGSSTRVCR